MFLFGPPKFNTNCHLPRESARMCAWCADGVGKRPMALVMRYGALQSGHQAVKLERIGARSSRSISSLRECPASRTEA